MSNKIQRAQALLAKFANQRILVIGDLMLDRYIYGTVERISPEAPVPVIRTQDERNMPGGAANVAYNVQALGGCAMLCGVLGQDAAGQDLLQVLNRKGIDASAILSLPGLQTTVKTRIIAERQQVARVDCEDRLKLAGAALQSLCRQASLAVRQASGVIIEDYSKGAISQELLKTVLSAARRSGVPVALDPKHDSNFKLKGLSVVTPNRKEAFALAGLPEEPPCANPLADSALIRVAEKLLKQWLPDFLVITLGAQGMLLARAGQAPIHIPTVAREVFEVSGAGDTVIAALALSLSAGASAGTAVQMANCAAGVVVGKLGTAVCTAEELLAFYRELAGVGKRARRAR